MDCLRVWVGKFLCCVFILFFWHDAWGTGGESHRYVLLEKKLNEKHIMQPKIKELISCDTGANISELIVWLMATSFDNVRRSTVPGCQQAWWSCAYIGMTTVNSTLRTPMWRYIVEMFGEFVGKLMCVTNFWNEKLQETKNFIVFTIKLNSKTYLLKLRTHSPHQISLSFTSSAGILIFDEIV